MDDKRIREAFEKEYREWLKRCTSEEEQDAFLLFEAGYKQALSESQKEIELLKDIIIKMYECRFEPDKLDIYRRQAKNEK